MSGLQRGLVCLIPIAAAVVLSLAAVSLKLSLASVMAGVSSPLFMSTALAISILAFRRGEIGHLLSLGALLSVALAVLIVACDGALRNS